MIKTKDTFTWMHLTDIHAGMKNQNWLWPTLKHQFFSDLDRMITLIGDLDLVIFSGDLTQQADIHEYEAFEAIISEIWKKFEELGVSPKLFMVPGNHDLSRPDKSSAHRIALEKYEAMPEIQDSLWASSNEEYLNFINNMFKAFQAHRTS